MLVTNSSSHIPCSSLLTVEHNIRISCIDFGIICPNFYTSSNLEDLLHNIHPKRIISFIHAIGLTNKLLNFLRHDVATSCVLKMPLNLNHPSIHPSTNRLQSFQCCSEQTVINVHKCKRPNESTSKSMYFIFDMYLSMDCND